MIEISGGYKGSKHTFLAFVLSAPLRTTGTQWYRRAYASDYQNQHRCETDATLSRKTGLDQANAKHRRQGKYQLPRENGAYYISQLECVHPNINDITVERLKLGPRSGRAALHPPCRCNKKYFATEYERYVERGEYRCTILKPKVNTLLQYMIGKRCPVPVRSLAEIEWLPSLATLTVLSPYFHLQA